MVPVTAHEKEIARELLRVTWRARKSWGRETGNVLEYVKATSKEHATAIVMETWTELAMAT